MPPLFVDGVEITEVFIDGVEQDNVFVDGVEVFSKGGYIMIPGNDLGFNGYDGFVAPVGDLEPKFFEDVEIGSLGTPSSSLVNLIPIDFTQIPGIGVVLMTITDGPSPINLFWSGVSYNATDPGDVYENFFIANLGNQISLTLEGSA